VNWRNTEETKPLQRNVLSLGSIKLEQKDELDTQLNRNGYPEQFTFECSGHIFCKEFVHCIKNESDL